MSENVKVLRGVVSVAVNGAIQNLRRVQQMSKNVGRGIQEAARNVQQGARRINNSLQKTAQKTENASRSFRAFAVNAAAAVKTVSRQVDELGRKFGPAARRIQMASRQVVTSLTLIAGAATAAVAAFTAVGFSANAMQETTLIAFETLMGSAQDALGMMQRLREFAAATPFQLPGLARMAQGFLALKMEGGQVITTIRAIADSVSALGGGEEILQRVSMAIRQMLTLGRVQAEDMRQLTEAGLPAWEMLANAIGVTVPEAMEMSSRGAIEASTAVAGLVEQMDERFGGMAEKLATTLTGRLSTLKDNFREFARTVTGPLADTIKDQIAGVLDFRDTDRFRAFVIRVTDGFRAIANEWTALVATITGDDAIGSAEAAFTGLLDLIARMIAGFREAWPLIQSIVSALGSLLGAVFRLAAEFPNLTAALIALRITGIMGLNSAVGVLIQLLMSAGNGLFGLTGKLTAAAGAAGTATTAITLAKTAMFGFGAAIAAVLAYQLGKWLIDRAHDFEALRDASKEATDEIQKLADIQIAREIAGAGTDEGALADLYDRTARSLAGVRQQIAGIQEEIAGADGEIAANLSATLGELESEAVRLEIAMEKIGDAATKAGLNLADVAAAAVSPVERLRDGLEAIGGTGARTGSLTDATRDLKDMAAAVDAVRKVGKISGNVTVADLQSGLEDIQRTRSAVDQRARRAAMRRERMGPLSRREQLAVAVDEDSLNAALDAVRRLGGRVNLIDVDAVQEAEGKIEGLAEAAAEVGLDAAVTPIALMIDKLDELKRRSAETATDQVAAEAEPNVREATQRAIRTANAEFGKAAKADPITASLDRQALRNAEGGTETVFDFLNLGPSVEQLDTFIRSMGDLPPELIDNITGIYDQMLTSGEFTRSALFDLAEQTARNIKMVAEGEKEAMRLAESERKAGAKVSESVREEFTAARDAGARIPALDIFANQFLELEAQFNRGALTAQEFATQSGAIVEQVSALTQAQGTFGNVMDQMRDRLPAHQLQILRDNFGQLQQALADGELSLETFTMAVGNLSDEARQMDLARQARGQFTQAEFGQSVQQQMIAFQQQQLQERARQQAIQSLLAMGHSVQQVEAHFGSLNPELDKFRDNLRRQIQQRQSNLQRNSGRIAEAQSRLFAFLNSQTGRITTLYNNIQLVQQKLTLGVADTFREQRAVLNQLSVMQAELNRLTAPRAPVLRPTEADFLRDPGTQSTTNNITVEFPMANLDSPRVARSLFEAIENEGRRRGR